MSRINHKAVYQVKFNSNELVEKSIDALEKELKVTPLQYRVQTGVQRDAIEDEQLQQGDGFVPEQMTTEFGKTVHSAAQYDLVENVSGRVDLMRETIAKILAGVTSNVFDQFKQNPEHLIAEVSRIINEQQVTMIIDKLQYNETNGQYDVDIFTVNQSRQDFTKAQKTCLRLCHY